MAFDGDRIRRSGTHPNPAITFSYQSFQRRNYKVRSTIKTELENASQKRVQSVTRPSREPRYTMMKCILRILETRTPTRCDWLARTCSTGLREVEDGPEKNGLTITVAHPDSIVPASEYWIMTWSQL